MVHLCSGARGPDHRLPLNVEHSDFLYFLKPSRLGIFGPSQYLKGVTQFVVITPWYAAWLAPTALRAK